MVEAALCRVAGRLKIAPAGISSASRPASFCVFTLSLMRRPAESSADDKCGRSWSLACRMPPSEPPVKADVMSCRRSFDHLSVLPYESMAVPSGNAWPSLTSNAPFADGQSKAVVLGFGLVEAYQTRELGQVLLSLVLQGARVGVGIGALDPQVQRRDGCGQRIDLADHARDLLVQSRGLLRDLVGGAVEIRRQRLRGAENALSHGGIGRARLKRT